MPEQPALAPSGASGGAPVSVAPPSRALAYLRANPQFADQFDAKYGQGMASQFLSQPRLTSASPGAAQPAPQPQAPQQAAEAASAAEDGAPTSNMAGLASSAASMIGADGVAKTLDDVNAGASSGAVKALGETVQGLTAIKNPLSILGLSSAASDKLQADKEAFGAAVSNAADRFADSTFHPESALGRAAEGIMQFTTDFIGAGKALKAMKFMQEGGHAITATKAMVQSGMADWFSFDGAAPRMGNWLMSMGLDNPVTQWMAGSEEDTQGEGRAKAALEGFGLGLGIDATMRGLKFARGFFAETKAAKSKAAAEAAAHEYMAKNAAELDALYDAYNNSNPELIKMPLAAAADRAEVAISEAEHAAGVAGGVTVTPRPSAVKPPKSIPASELAKKNQEQAGWLEDIGVQQPRNTGKAQDPHPKKRLFATTGVEVKE